MSPYIGPLLKGWDFDTALGEYVDAIEDDDAGSSVDNLEIDHAEGVDLAVVGHYFGIQFSEYSDGSYSEFRYLSAYGVDRDQLILALRYICYVSECTIAGGAVPTVEDFRSSSRAA